MPNKLLEIIMFSGLSLAAWSVQEIGGVSPPICPGAVFALGADSFNGTLEICQACARIAGEEMGRLRYRMGSPHQSTGQKDTRQKSELSQQKRDLATAIQKLNRWIAVCGGLKH